MHQNFSDYVNFMRVTKAANMLTTTDESVTDIGLTVGFSTTSYFIEQFKSFKELTPLQYRKNFKEMVNASLSSAHEVL
jgi:AraC-like DNA-binding protein